MTVPLAVTVTVASGLCRAGMCAVPGAGGRHAVTAPVRAVPVATMAAGSVALGA